MGLFVKRVSWLVLLLVVAGPLQAREIAGVTLRENIRLDESGETLVLNGAGIRSKFLFNIYVAALYLPKPAISVGQIMDMSGHKRMAMHFTYSQVTKDTLGNTFEEGFKKNINDVELAALRPRIEQFNQLLATVNEGDVIYLDLLPGDGTRVSINDKVMGLVPGDDFYNSLLLIWLGKEPVGETLKIELLGIKDDNNG